MLGYADLRFDKRTPEEHDYQVYTRLSLASYLNSQAGD